MVVLGNIREGLRCPIELVFALAGLAGEGVDRAQKEVARDVLEVSPILEPGPSHGDVVGGALTLGLEQDRQVKVILSVPSGKGFEKLQAIRGGRNLDADATSILWGRHKGVLAWGESERRKFFSDGLGQKHLLARGVGERVTNWIKVERPGKCECHNCLG